MFDLSFSSPCEIQGEITLKKWPTTLGNYEDVVTGESWNVRGIFGGRDENDEMAYWVQAVSLGGLHIHYKRTDGLTDYDPQGTAPENSGIVSQRWLPYKVVLQDE